MDALILGAGIGFMVASVFVAAGLMMVFSFIKNSTPDPETVSRSGSMGRLVMPVVALAYPTWGAVGAALGLVYEAATESAPGGGLGSPNQTFTIAVLAVTTMLAAPAVLILRRVLPGVIVIALTSAGLFGWLLPLLAE